MAAALVLAALPLTACDVGFAAEAKNQWTKSYPLTTGGTLEIHNTNGKIDVQQTDGTTVEIVAERVVRAGSDDEAKAALAKFDIVDKVSADHITLEAPTKSDGGLFSGLSHIVNYTVKLPKGANVKLDVTNGEILARGLTGTFHATATNGEITASGLENTADARTTNGEISLDFTKLGPEGVHCETTNGEVRVIVPRDVKADVSISVTNGDFSTSGLDVTVTDKSRRSMSGKIGGGGPVIKLEATNGDLKISAK